jgi:long-chain acyl-CoA synthetase
MARFDRNGDPVNDFQSLAWGETRRQSLELASGLMALGVSRGDKVAIFSESRPRWIIADQAILACGGIEVPLYPTLSRDEFSYMIGNSESTVVFCSTRDKVEMARAVKPETMLRIIISMETCESRPDQGVYHFNEVMEMGRKSLDPARLEESIAAARPEDLVSIIYTSGTTGMPKGAMLTHANWIASLEQVTDPTLMRRQALDTKTQLLFLVHLPICHVYGRTCDYHSGGLKQGGILAFEPDFGRIPKTLRELRPNVIVSIPRFFEKVYDQINAVMAKQPPLARRLFAWAMRQGEKYTDAMSRGVRLGMLDLYLFSQANILVFNRIRREAGIDRLVMAGSGGGKLSKDVCTFFRSMGVQLTEGYGMTETAAILNYNSPEFRGLDRDNFSWFQSLMIEWTLDCMVREQAKGKSPYTHPLLSLKLMVAYLALAHRLQVKAGTVGRPVVGTEEKLADDGEILVKGPQIFKGYWGMPEESAASFTEDGWFCTGDIGRFDEDGFLEITDRKKDLFVTSGGKNVAPHPIELALIARPYIDQACLTGDGRKYLTALIVPDFEVLKRFARERGLDGKGPEELIASEEVKALIQSQVDEVNNHLSRYEQIKYFTLLPKPFSVEGGELTPTLKIKRRVIRERFHNEIERMYQA